MKIKLTDVKKIGQPNILVSKPYNYNVFVITIIADHSKKLEELLKDGNILEVEVSKRK